MDDGAEPSAKLKNAAVETSRRATLYWRFIGFYSQP
jgi:hypothetical protein